MSAHTHPACRPWLAAAALLALAACSTPPAAPPAAVLKPPAALRIEGAPPLPADALATLARYGDVAGHGFADWHPVKREMLVTHRPPGQSTTQLYRLAGPRAALEPLTDGAERVTSAEWEPVRGRYIVFERDVGGDEATQLYRLDPSTRAVTQLTPSGERHDLAGWLPRQGRLVFSSVPLDRTAAGGTRATVSTRLTSVDPLAADIAASRRLLVELPGPGWFGFEVSPDERQAAITRYVSATNAEVWLIDLASGERRRVLPAPGETLRAAHFVSGWTADGRGLLVLSDRASEFREMMRLDLASGQLQRITGHIPWDVSDGDGGEGLPQIALALNVDGRDELRLFDAASGAERAVPSAPPGSVTRLRFHRGSGELAVVTNSAQGPSQVHVLNLATGRHEAWTRPVTPPGLDLSRMPEQQIVRWKSFDGRTISGVLSLPPAHFTGRRPVLMSMHGGPEGQSQQGWNGRLNYFLLERGVAILEPNVRGSSGYGKTFLDLDNGRLREDSVKDMASAIDWTATHPRLDGSKVVVMGGSYGGYMALAAATRLADKIAGAYSAVGISNFVTFLENTESYRRDLRRAEYGDERDPGMRAFLQSISPLTLADQVTKPLLITQGRNDPRVPWTESEQIVRRLQQRGVPVWYLLADNEGHGFARRENADYALATLVRFLETTVLK
jgi:dipeptidyl aminopeptidase/acylaminoacyl peptidase